MEKRQNSLSVMSLLGWLLSLTFIWSCSSDSSAPASVISAANGEMISITFPDGSSAVLNDGSSISYDEANWNKSRSVGVNGEVYIEALKGKQFMVNGQQGKVEVVESGNFTVRTWGNELLVECFYGHIQVIKGEERFDIVERQGLKVKADGKLEHRMVTYNQPLWKSGKSMFVQSDVNDVLAELGRQYDITIDNPGVYGIYSGTFRHDNLKTSVYDICNKVNLKFELSDDEKTLKIFPQ